MDSNHDSEPKTRGTEIVVGLVGALGVDMDTFAKLVGQALETVHFSPSLIRLSKLMESVTGFELATNSESEYYDEKVFGLMESGNKLRALLGGDALANLAILNIRQHRKEQSNDENIPLDRTGYILRSLKHPDEVKRLREIYGDSFFLFAGYSPRDKRVANVTKQVQESRAGHHGEVFESKAVGLVQKDEEEQNNEFGQQVRKTFWRGDAFIDMSEPGDAEKSITRIVQLWFGSPYITPSRDEYAMFIARAAAYRSAAMGRQVGASIATKEGSIVATGTNEVAKAEGGQYWEGDPHDARDHMRGQDSSDMMKRQLLEDAITRLIQIGWRPPADQATKSLVAGLVNHPEMAMAEVQALTEYMRAVHAEMAALMDAAGRGVAVAGCTLYATTFPCHSCARHIVAAGIKRVVYIEPYAKSLVKTLYSDSISVDESSSDHRVRFEAYMGLAPRRYLRLFMMGVRKDEDGKTVDWNPSDKLPRLGGWESWLSVEKENRMAVDFRLLLQAKLDSKEGGEK